MTPQESARLRVIGELLMSMHANGQLDQVGLDLVVAGKRVDDTIRTWFADDLLTGSAEGTDERAQKVGWAFIEAIDAASLVHSLVVRLASEVLGQADKIMPPHATSPAKPLSPIVAARPRGDWAEGNQE
ncbi:molybdopterin-guanine dinucleotide biosynthesis protein A [Crossiella equi]|uniref:Molybdopterin-guanine dinucleotide biosynthesis protein A n=1 Tax=Crossiella equi TaxID=130796 RepID=A0ABS5APM3_9PSEU|nr:hypothetical protein [Crossiella equi]MBP2477625.1 molybdopterin-guanine dinucleotide biosynthesis protein A [Crossiella equi]